MVKLLTKIKINDFLILLLIPNILLLINDNWIFAPTTGFIDAWIYFGYFKNLINHLHFFPTTYYSGRFSWTLPGFVMYYLFPPLIANYLLHMCVYLISVFSIYLILRLMVHRYSALLTASLMGSYVWFLRAAGLNYVDGPGVMYISLVLLSLSLSIKTRFSSLFLFFCGLFFACAVFTHFFLLSFFPFFLLLYILLTHKNNRITWKHIFSWVAGFCTLTFFFGLINYQINHYSLFFIPSIKTAIALVSENNQWHKSIFQWLNDASWMIWLTTVFVIYVFVLLKNRLSQSKKNLSDYAFGVVFVLLFMYYAAFQISHRAPILQLYYYSNYLIPFMFLAIGTLSQHLKIPQKQKNLNFLYLFPLTFPLFYFLGTISLKWANPLMLIFGLFLVSLCGMTLLTQRNLKYTIVGFILLSGSSGLMVPIAPTAFHEFLHPNSGKDGFLAVNQAVDIINKTLPQSEWYFWYDASEPTVAGVYKAIASTYLYQYRLLGTDFPQFDTKFNQKNGFKVILMSKDPLHSYQIGVERLKKATFSSIFIARSPIYYNNQILYMNFLEVYKQQKNLK